MGNRVWIVDIAIPEESRIEKKKNMKYQDLQAELEHLWEKKVPLFQLSLKPLEQCLEVARNTWISSK